MKKYLLSENKNSYKANLHCHTNLSDARLSPDEVKKAYMEHGYSIVAYTDHDIMIDHSDLNEEGFLALRGFEMEITDDKPVDILGGRKTCHACFIALDKDNLIQPMWSGVDEKYFYGNAKKHADKVKFDKNEPEYKRIYTVEAVSDMLKRGREKGFFVTYNHPIWSGENFEQYAYYEGMHAMEICNYGCYEAGHPEYNSSIYDDMLRTGKRIYCISADDNHNGGANWAHDSFGGFTVIMADKLEYRTITKALEEGDFYASMGPEIHELYLEDNILHVKCSPAKRICLNVGRTRYACKKKATVGEYITEASFAIDKKNDIYFRLDIYDENGNAANTNAYFCDEVFES